MKNIIIISLVVVFGFSSCQYAQFDYPETKKVDVKDDYFGTVVSDPYRWLEDDRSEETAMWVEEQNRLTFEYLDKIPYRNSIKERLTELWNYEKMGAPMEHNGKYYFFKNDGLQNQDVMYSLEKLNDEPIIVLDPNNFSDDGTVALSNYEFSNDGKYLAYSISRGGSDWREIYVKDIETGELLSDHLEWIKFSGIAWYKNGFFYSRYDEPESGEELSQKNENHKVYYHMIGTDQEQDALVFQDLNFPLRNYMAQVTSDEKYLFVYETESTNGNNLFIKNLEINNDFIQLTKGFNYDYLVVDNIKDHLIVLTNYRSPKYKLIRINANSLDIGNWVDILPERKDVLADVELAKGKILATYIVDAHHELEVYNLRGELENEIELPSVGSIKSVRGSKTGNLAFYKFESFANPGTVYAYNIDEKTSEVFFQPEVLFNPEDYESKQVFFESKDGTEIPMYIVYKKGMELNGKNPTLLYAYGGFNSSKMPTFKVSTLSWMDAGGIYAHANIRGGGEYGEKWHLQGMKLNKQNVFDDFVYAAKYLIAENFTSPDHLAIKGASNGGLLIGTVINQAPEMFKVAFPEVGVMDMLRFHKFTIGWAWVDEYGSSEDSLDFENLYNYSPLHNISDELDHPAVMVLTADHDDRVVPAHSFKYIATLQEKSQGSNPAFIRIQTNAGHGAGMPTSFQIQEVADKWAFAFYNMDFKPKY